MDRTIVAISNHGLMLGGGEYSFLDLLSHMPSECRALALVPEKNELAFRLARNGIDTLVRPLPPIRPWLVGKVLYALKEYINLFMACAPGLVYANGSRAAFYGGIACRACNIPLVWHCRIARRDPYLDSILCRLSSCIIANSIATSTRFRGFHNKTKIIYNGVDLQWLTDPSVEKAHLIEDDWKVILVVARVSRDKRHDIILSSFEKIAKNDLSAHLVCLGSKDLLDAPWWNRLQEKTLASEAKHRIHWIGHVDDVRPWYKGACLLVQGSENESFGRVLVEAMACGLPVVATRSGGVPEIVREGLDGLLAAPGSAHEISEHILKLFRDETLRNRISESGRKRAEEFSIETHVNRMVHVFEEALGYQAKRVGR